MSEDHYFSADPSVPFTRTPVRLEAWGTTADLVSGSGVFAHGRLDRGTAVLLGETGPPTTAGRLLDLGCGWGVLTVALALAVPDASVTGVDVNRRALALTRENAERAGVADRVTACAPQEVPDAEVWDEMWSNPPIRIGKVALHSLLLTWLPRLAPEGRAVMVVSKNLGADSLQRWLGEQGWPTTRLAGAKGFRVLETRRGQPPLP